METSTSSRVPFVRSVSTKAVAAPEHVQGGRGGRVGGGWGGAEEFGKWAKYHGKHHRLKGALFLLRAQTPGAHGKPNAYLPG